MNKFQSIKISLISRSDTNIRKEGFKGPEFDDLVASIKEKGVLVPIIVRKKKNSTGYEVVAGERRLRAANIVGAGLGEIPAIVRDLTDDEAREVQLIENLQRLDVHPLDEGFGYRQLIEKSKYNVENIAIKMGKAQNYIRQRLFLTNLNERPANAYRKGEITEGHAVLIAKLSPNDQAKAMKYLKDAWDLPTVKDFKEWIEQEYYHPLASQPWLKDKEANRAVGKCIECSPNLNTLFGEVKEGACTDLKCWKRKMGKYVDYQIADAKLKGIELLKVSKEYSYSPRGKVDAGIITRGNYELLSFKKKDQCKYAQKAMVAVGPDMGTFLWVCVSSECPTHHSQHSDYSTTPKEKERRRKEVKKQKAKREKEEKRIVEALEKIKWPLNEKTLDVMFELILSGQGTTVLRPVAKRLGLVPKKTTSSGYTYFDWEATLRKAAEKMDNAEKARVITGVLLERTYSDLKNKVLKMF